MTVRQQFGPQVVALAHFMRDPDAPFDMVPFLEEVDRRWPGLSFRDFFGACVLAEALAMKVEGTA
jgi:hypothetical protein